MFYHIRVPEHIAISNVYFGYKWVNIEISNNFISKISTNWKKAWYQINWRLEWSLKSSL